MLDLNPSQRIPVVLLDHHQHFAYGSMRQYFDLLPYDGKFLFAPVPIADHLINIFFKTIIYELLENYVASGLCSIGMCNFLSIYVIIEKYTGNTPNNSQALINKLRSRDMPNKQFFCEP